MLRCIITALLFFTAHALAQSPSLAPPALTDNAPDQYTVKPGDTLWSIARTYLKEPWRWRELWGKNGQSTRIYPGQVLFLDAQRGAPRLSLGRELGVVKLQPQVHESRTNTPIPAIPLDAIAPFLSEPRIVEAGALDQAPRIVATEEDRVYLGVGQQAYVLGLPENATTLWQVFRPAQPIYDPVTRKLLGLEAFYLGSLQLEDTTTPARMRVHTAKREMGVGDLLQAANPPEMPFYTPHAPDDAMAGRVASIYEGVDEAGRNSIITVNLGQAQGVEVGHVLALYREGQSQQALTLKQSDGKTSQRNLSLPPERFGLVMVFRVFERLSYALIMNTTRAVHVGDVLRTPNRPATLP